VLVTPGMQGCRSTESSAASLSALGSTPYLDMIADMHGSQDIGVGMPTSAMQMAGSGVATMAVPTTLFSPTCFALGEDKTSCFGYGTCLGVPDRLRADPFTPVTGPLAVRTPRSSASSASEPEMAVMHWFDQWCDLAASPGTTPSSNFCFDFNDRLETSGANGSSIDSPTFSADIDFGFAVALPLPDNFSARHHRFLTASSEKPVVAPPPGLDIPLQQHLPVSPQKSAISRPPGLDIQPDEVTFTSGSGRSSGVSGSVVGAFDMPPPGLGFGLDPLLAETPKLPSTSKDASQDQLQQAPPAGSSAAEQLPTNPGSLGHPEFCPRPCLYFAVGECQNGNACSFCHLDHPHRVPHLDKRHRMLLQSTPWGENLRLALPILREKAGKLGVSDDIMQPLWDLAAEQQGTEQITDANMPGGSNRQRRSGKQSPFLAIKALSLRTMLTALKRAAGPQADAQHFCECIDTVTSRIQEALSAPCVA